MARTTIRIQWANPWNSVPVLYYYYYYHIQTTTTTTKNVCALWYRTVAVAVRVGQSTAGCRGGKSEWNPCSGQNETPEKHGIHKLSLPLRNNGSNTHAHGQRILKICEYTYYTIATTLYLNLPTYLPPSQYGTSTNND